MVATAAAASYLERPRLGLVAFGAGAVATVLTLFVMHDFGATAAKVGFDGVSGAWNNLGVGGWLMASALTLSAGAGWMVARAEREAEKIVAGGDSDQLAVSSSNVTQAMLVAVIAAALFYPPMATQFWQTVLVTEIGIYVLLAIGLNVVVGWAGLLDLGFIAFYAIGSYTTAYFTGRAADPAAGLAAPLAAAGDPVRGDHLSARRCGARGADPAPARRLPRDRHPGLR